MTQKPTYAEYDTVPAYEVAVWRPVDGRIERELVNADAPVKWGGKDAPPAIGTEIVVTMNNLGPATVTGYFVEHGWLGLLTTLRNPPDWHRRQNDGDPRGHIFGPEFRRA